MTALRVLVALAIVGQLATAIALFAELPHEIPVHFDAIGRPDSWVRADGFEWFSIPALLAVAGVVCGFVLPMVAVEMARRRSQWLNVPDRERFYALPEQARVGAMRPVVIGLSVIAFELQALMVFLLVGTYLVAVETWEWLPPIGIYGLTGLLLVTAIVLAVTSSRAVRRAVRRIDESTEPIA